MTDKQGRGGAGVSTYNNPPKSSSKSGSDNCRIAAAIAAAIAVEMTAAANNNVGN
jgi:hypothetical protein